MKHVFEVHKDCRDPFCGICEGGLKLCVVCRQAEGDLADECPGKTVYVGHDVAAGEIS